MRHCVGVKGTIVRLLVFTGCLLLVQKTHAFRKDSYLNEDSFSVSEHQNLDEKTPRLYSTNRNNDDRIDSESKPEDKVSNYDFYMPLNQRTKERKYYAVDDEVVHKEHVEPTDDLSPYIIYKNQEKKWLKDQDSSAEPVDKDGYGYENYEITKEEPIYGYNADGSYEITKPNGDSSWSDDTHSHHGDLANEKYSLNSWKQPNERSPYKHNQYELKSSYPKVYKIIEEHPTDIEYLNPKAWNSYEDSPPLNDYNIKNVYKNEELPSDVDKYENVKSKEWHDHKNDYKYPSSEHHHEKHGNEPCVLKEHHFSKPESINEGKREYKHEYSHPSKEVKGSAIPGLLHGKLGGEDDIDKYLKTEYLKTRPFTTSKFNHGGHIYGWSYKPYEYLHQKYQADLDAKKKFLQEHEKKLVELQKKHMESFKKFMDKEFLGAKHEYPDFRMAAIDDVHKKPNHQEDSKSFYDKEPRKKDVPSGTHHYSLP